MFGQSFFSAKRFVFIIGLLAVLSIGATVLFAATGGFIDLDGSTGAYQVAFTPNNNDEGSGIDRVMVVCFTPTFDIIDTDRVDRTTGGSSEVTNGFCDFGTVYGAVCLYDITADIPTNTYDSATLANIAAGPIIAQDGGACGFGSPAGASGTAGIFDGRLNWGDLGASAAIYCHQGGYRVYEIGSDGRGTLVMELTRDEVGAAMTEAAGDTNVLVRTAGDVQFWILAPGDKFYQVVSPEVNEPGKMYNFLGELIC
jgi:hypothetical protein